MRKIVAFHGVRAEMAPRRSAECDNFVSTGWTSGIFLALLEERKDTDG
jgi:hypothetical protein